MKSKNNKAFRREHEQSLHDFEAGKDFLNETQKLLTMNKKKISLITLKLKPLLVKKLAKKSSHRMYYMHKGLISIIYIHIHICVYVHVCMYVYVCVYKILT